MVEFTNLEDWSKAFNAEKEDRLKTAYAAVWCVTPEIEVNVDVWEQEDSDDEEEFTRGRLHQRHGQKRTFTPPMQTQRNLFVRDALKESNRKGGAVEKLAVLGCGELSLERFLVADFAAIGLGSITSIDIDCRELYRGIEFYKEYLEKQKRMIGGFDCNPVTVEVMKGDILDTDDRLIGVDAVACIEVIEHMPLEEATKVLHQILEVIRPKTAIISTPNREYNQVFNSDVNQFRHDDHKFEFTRDEFIDWIADNYDAEEYAVEVSYVGNLVGYDHLGGATQFAVFTRRTSPAPTDVTPPVERRTMKRAASFVVPCGLRWLTKRLALRTFKRFVEQDKLSECTTVELGLKYYSVPFSTLIESAEEDEKEVLLRQPDLAVKTISAATLMTAYSLEKEGEWQLMVQFKATAKELIQYMDRGLAAED